MRSKLAIVVGGGFFGCKVAILLAQKGFKVFLAESEDQLLLRASYNNQARVHNGYHYPRSVLTALRSRVNFPRFIRDYPQCIADSFEKYYAIGRIHSKVNATQFKQFCETIGAEAQEAPRHISALFDKRLIEKVFAVREYAFDADILRTLVMAELEQAGLEVMFKTKCIGIESGGDRLKAFFQAERESFELEADYIFNCTYSGINTLLKASTLAPLPLKHEFTEMALIKLPAPLDSLGVTVMCGPFFSFMPFPPRSLHSLSHVRYTPHYYWYDHQNDLDNSKIWATASRESNYHLMIRDIARYIPLISESEYLGSLWEIKTILPQSEYSDSRPILYHRHPQMPNLISIMGGKIDNIYDLAKEMEAIQ